MMEQMLQTCIDAHKYAGDAMPTLKKPLVCVVTGLDYSGTTLISQILNAHPRVTSSFECGLMWGLNIKKFPAMCAQSKLPFYDWLIDVDWGWGLLSQQRDEIINSGNYEFAYQLLCKYKGTAHSEGPLKDLFVNSDLIYDKAPAYVHVLSETMDQMDVPFVVVLKNPREAWESWSKRMIDIKYFLHVYENSIQQIARAKRNHGNRLLIINYKQLTTNFEQVVAAFQDHIGLNDMTLDLEKYNQRFGQYYKTPSNFSSKEVKYISSKNQKPSKKEHQLIKASMEKISKDMEYIYKNQLKIH